MLPDAGEIIDKIRQWQVTAGSRPLEVAFFGGSFTALPEDVQTRLLDPLQPLLKCGELVSVRISTRPDYISGPVVARLAAAGVSVIELGVQSLDDGVLQASGRGHSAADAVNAIRCVAEQGVNVVAQLMPGLPGDTPAVSLASLEGVISAGADYLRIYPTVVLRGTELARRYVAGEFRPPGNEQVINLCKILLHRAMQLNVPVLRIGLQADDGLNTDALLAGCWHPALGQLVRSRLYADLVNLLVSDGESITVWCHPSRVSDLVGQKRVNVDLLAARGVRLRVFPDVSRAVEELVLQNDSVCRMYNLLNDLHYSIDEV